jgi:hypothetical protein
MNQPLKVTEKSSYVGAYISIQKNTEGDISKKMKFLK